jgi:hypothetical protein
MFVGFDFQYQWEKLGTTCLFLVGTIELQVNFGDVDLVPAIDYQVDYYYKIISCRSRNNFEEEKLLLFPVLKRPSSQGMDSAQEGNSNQLNGGDSQMRVLYLALGVRFIRK